MTRLRWGLLGGLGLVVLALYQVPGAKSASPVAVCGLSGTSSESNCIAPASNGSIPVTGSFTGSGQAASASSVSVVTSTDEPNIGVPGATACATDTGSCSLNALLQRIAQRLTTLIASLGGTGSTGAAPPATAAYIAGNGSGATGGLLTGLKTCDQHAKYDASDNGSITMVTGVSGRKVYICGYILATGGTATNLKLREGSDANCATNGADLTPAYQLVANDKIGAKSAFWDGLVVSTNAYYVCVNASAGNAHQAELWYTIQ